VSLSQGIRVGAVFTIYLAHLTSHLTACAANKAVSFLGVVWGQQEEEGCSSGLWLGKGRWAPRLVAPWFIRENAAMTWSVSAESGKSYGQRSHTNQSMDLRSRLAYNTDWLIFSHVLNAQLSNELEPAVWGPGHIWQCPTEPVIQWLCGSGWGTQVSPSLSLCLCGWLLSLERQVLAIRKPAPNGAPSSAIYLPTNHLRRSIGGCRRSALPSS